VGFSVGFFSRSFSIRVFSRCEDFLFSRGEVFSGGFAGFFSTIFSRVLSRIFSRMLQ